MKNINGLKRILIMGCISLAILFYFRCGGENSFSKADDSTLTQLWASNDQLTLLNSLDVFLTLSEKDEYGIYLPALMESWEESPDFREATAHIRRGVTWDDGVPVTAEDVKFSLDLWTHPDVFYEPRTYKSITIIDDYTLKFEFEKAFQWRIHWYSWLAILPKHLLETHAPNELFDWEFWNHPLGNGRYRFVRRLPNQIIELEANPNYYGKKPKIKRLIFRFGGNNLTELMSGNVDMIHWISPQNAMYLEKDPRFRVYYSIGYGMHNTLVWNHRLTFFNDSKLRKALTLAINRRELHKILNFPDNIPIYDMPALPRHPLRGLVPNPLPYDPDQAKLFLKESGWIDRDNNGIREKDGKEFRFTLLADSGLTEASVYVQDQLRQVGIHIEIQNCG